MKDNWELFTKALLDANLHPPIPQSGKRSSSVKKIMVKRVGESSNTKTKTQYVTNGKRSKSIVKSTHQQLGITDNYKQS